jgi:mRNA interferase MazF
MARAGASYVPARGDFVRIGREQSGEQPALVLSERRFNELTGYVFAAPVTGTKRGWPFEVTVPSGGKIEGVVLADQTKCIDYAAQQVRFHSKAPDGLVQSVIDLVTTILSP